MKPYARAYRPKMKKGQMNQTELAYAEHLQKLKLAGEIIDYAYEAETLRIGQDCRYTPDFRVITRPKDDTRFKIPDGMTEYIEFHEVKGTTKKKSIKKMEDGSLWLGKVSAPLIEDDALVKIKAAAEMHPYKFIIVWKGVDGSWQKREIN